MATTGRPERRNWERLAVTIPAFFSTPDGRIEFTAPIVEISENGVGFTAAENLLGLQVVNVSFWLPFDASRPNEAMLEPIAVRLTLISTRYVPDLDAYAYGTVFVGLPAGVRTEIRTHIKRAGRTVAI